MQPHASTVDKHAPPMQSYGTFLRPSVRISTSKQTFLPFKRQRVSIIVRAEAGGPGLGGFFGKKGPKEVRKRGPLTDLFKLDHHKLDETSVYGI